MWLVYLELYYAIIRMQRYSASLFPDCNYKLNLRHNRIKEESQDECYCNPLHLYSMLSLRP